MSTKILITESSAAVSKLYRYYLEPLGCEFQVADNTEDCIRFAVDWKPDLITLGMELAGSSGLETCQKLKENPGCNLIPIVMISSQSQDEMQVRAFEAGVIEYIIKPCTPDHLRRRVESILDPIERKSEVTSNTKKYKVLVAEDSRAIMLLYEYLLDQLECEIIPCEDGLLAWAQLCKFHDEIDLVISDIHMPHMDGRELAKRMRSNPQFNQVPLVMSSTVKELQEIKALLHLGANDYVTKPFSHEEFAARVRAHLRTRSLMHEQERLNHQLSSMNEVLEEKVQTRTREIREANISAIYMLAVASDAKDKDTGNHIHRVRFYSENLAKRLGFEDLRAEEIGYSSMMHDVGKLAIPDKILKKPGRLDPGELDVMRTHAAEGARILGDNTFFETARDIARCHHEKYDGSGYPEGLLGETIPIAARIVAVADIYDALSSKRAYKEAWTQDEVLVEIVNIAGTHLDPKVVDAFLEIVHDGTVDDIRKRFSDASFEDEVAQA